MNKTVIEVSALMFAVLLIVFLFYSYRHGLVTTMSQAGGHVVNLFDPDRGTTSNTSDKSSDSNNNDKNKNGNNSNKNANKNENTTVTDTINYQYDGQIISQTTMSGKNNQKITIDAQSKGIPTGYHLKNNNTSIPLTGGTYSVDVIPDVIRENDKVNFIDKNTGKSINTLPLSGVKGQSVNISAPDNYSFVNSNDSRVTLNGTTHTIGVNRTDVTGTVAYKDGNKTIKSFSVHGTIGQSAKSVIDSNMPNGYHALNNTDNFIYFSNGGSYYNYIAVNVAQNQVTDTVAWFFKGKFLGLADYTGTRGSSFQPGLTHYNLHSGYKPGNPSLTLIHDGSTHNLQAVPTETTGTVNYLYHGQNIKSFNTQGSDGTSAKSIIDSNVPSGFHVINNTDNFIWFDNWGKYHDNINVGVEQNNKTDTIQYIFQSKVVGTGHMTGTTGTTTHGIGNNPDGMPNGYHLEINSDANNKVVTYDGDVFQIAVVPNQVTATINYLDNNNNKIKTIYTKGNLGQSSKSVVDSNMPSGYHAINGTDSYTYWDAGGSYNNIINVNIQKNMQPGHVIHAEITYIQPRLINRSVIVQGITNNSAKSAIDSNVPDQYTVENNTDDVTFTDMGDGWDFIDVDVKYHWNYR